MRNTDFVYLPTTEMARMVQSKEQPVDLVGNALATPSGGDFFVSDKSEFPHNR